MEWNLSSMSSNLWKRVKELHLSKMQKDHHEDIFSKQIIDIGNGKSHRRGE